MNMDELLSQLSTREKQVVSFLVKGLSNKEIAKRLFVTEYTVKFHCQNIYTKMKVKNRVELMCATQYLAEKLYP